MRHIDQGSQFGVRIGMDRAAARKALERNWNIRFNGAYSCQHPEFHDKDCGEAQFKDSYEVSGGFRSGVIALYVRDNKIMRIEWWRHPFDP